MKELDTEYEEINMADIDDEARELAKRWAENMNDDFIAQKVKLASDFMNYARRKCKEQRQACTDRTIGESNELRCLVKETPLVI